MLGLRVLELRVRQAAQALDEQHHRRDPGAGDLGGVVERTAREPVGRARDLDDRFLREPDQGLVEQDRLDSPDALPCDLDLLLRGEPAGRILGLGEHRREPVGVEVPLVEQLLRSLHHRGDDPRPTDDVAAGTDRTAAGLGSDAPDVERQPGRACEGVAPLVHRRRAGVGGLARPGDPVALDAERAEDDAEREVERLEHGALLDVQLEVGGGVLQLRTATRSRGRGRRRVRRARPAARPRRGRSAAGAHPGRASTRPRRWSRTASGRSGRPPRRPS